MSEGYSDQGEIYSEDSMMNGLTPASSTEYAFSGSITSFYDVITPTPSLLASPTRYNFSPGKSLKITIIDINYLDNSYSPDLYYLQHNDSYSSTKVFNKPVEISFILGSTNLVETNVYSKISRRKV